MNWNDLGEHLVAAAIFGAVGIVLFLVALWVLRKTLPFSVEKEIAQDQNVALGIVMGAMLLGLAVIIAVSIAG
jgi:uncharacterized membrane protein YjfL (UPF0719 family)